MRSTVIAKCIRIVIKEETFKILEPNVVKILFIILDFQWIGDVFFALRGNDIQKYFAITLLNL